MKLRCLQSTYVNGTYYKGPEFADDSKPISAADELDVPDDFVVNPEVFEVVTPPAGGRKVIRWVELKTPTPTN